jgi:DNA (cytosine-5)-methyltransferase 1
LKPRALDLFCGAGGVSVGLQRAGFDVTGVDIHPQPRYRGGVFIQGDALTYPLDGFDFIWASPPCQAFTPLRRLQRGREYPNLIPAMRERLAASGRPWIIENVPGAPLAGNVVMLCGTMFGLQTPCGTAYLRRHRHFECSFLAMQPACQHPQRTALSVTGNGLDSNQARWAKRALSVVGKSAEISESGWHRQRAVTVTGNTAQTNTVRNRARQAYSIEDAQAAMGIDWMPMKWLSQAIPPAYAEYLGHQVIAAL